MSADHLAALDHEQRNRQVDVGLSALLVLQSFTLFVAIPLGGTADVGRVLLDVCHLLFAAICVGVLTRHRGIQVGLLVTLVLLVVVPAVGHRLGSTFHLDVAVRHEMIAVVAFSFNAGVTALVARHVFAPGRVTVHRVRGAILLYLNVAALFAIAFGAIAMNDAGAFAWSGGPDPAQHASLGTAIFSYFSLATITTTGYGDIVPLHPLARSLANLEAVFGQLFPATLLSRLVSLHLLQGGGGTEG